MKKFRFLSLILLFCLVIAAVSPSALALAKSSGEASLENLTVFIRLRRFTVAVLPL